MLASLLAALLALLLIAGALVYLYRAPLSVALAKRAAMARLSAEPSAELPDGLHIGLCGSGSPFPDDRRAGPCTLVLAGKRLFVFDAGSGSARNIGKMGFTHGHIEAIFLTHFHSDHIDGLGELLLQRWVSTGNTKPVTVYGGAGVESVLGGIMQTYSLDSRYRVAHHGDATVPASGFGGAARTILTKPDSATVLLKEGDLEIAAFPVDHPPIEPALGFRINYKDRSVVISGDTKRSATVQREAGGVDLLLHEALSAPLSKMLADAASLAKRPNLQKVFTDILDYHASPEEAAQTARDAKVGYLILHHIVPALPLPGLEKAFLGDAANIFKGPMRVGVDGDFISLPAGSKRIDLGRRF